MNIRRVIAVNKLVCFLVLTATICGPALAKPQTLSEAARAIFHPTRVKKDAPLWEKYLAAGDAMHVGKNEERARKYWKASLDELQKSGGGGHVGLFPRLEMRLLSMYPDDWSKTKLDDNRQKLQEEQVDVLKRASDLIRGYQVGSGDGRGLLNMAEIGYKKAVVDLDKTKAQLEANEQRQK